MSNLLTAALFVLTVSLTICAWIATLIYLRKSAITTGVQLQCGSGDSEVMVMNLNFLDGESEESKAGKLSEAWEMIEDRRQDNHLKMMKIRAEALKENEAKVDAGEDLKLKSVMQGKT